MGRTTIDELKNILDHHSLYLGMEINQMMKKLLLHKRLMRKKI